MHWCTMSPLLASMACLSTSSNRPAIGCVPARPLLFLLSLEVTSPLPTSSSSSHSWLNVHQPLISQYSLRGPLSRYEPGSGACLHATGVTPDCSISDLHKGPSVGSCLLSFPTGSLNPHALDAQSNQLSPPRAHSSTYTKPAPLISEETWGWGGPVSQVPPSPQYPFLEPHLCL